MAMSVPTYDRTITSMSTRMTLSEARAALPQLLDRVGAGEEVTITRHRKPAAVLVRPDTLRARRADVPWRPVPRWAMPSSEPTSAAGGTSPTQQKKGRHHDRGDWSLPITLLTQSRYGRLDADALIYAVGADHELGRQSVLCFPSSRSMVLVSGSVQCSSCQKC